MTPQPDRPDLFSYLDHRKWLSDWFDWKKACNPRFSHRMFARLAGQRSPSLLLLVCQGKRNLTAASMEGFIKATGLNDEEARFFRLLVELDGADATEDRNLVFERIAGTQRFQAARKLEGESFRYLSSWYLPAIRELATLNSFRADPDWIARTLHPPISRKDAQAALDTLFTLGLLVRRKDGAVHVAEVTIATPHEVAGLAAHNYHQGMIDRARASIGGSHPDQRHLGAVTVAVPSKDIAELKAEVASFLERFLDRCDRRIPDADQVFQLNVQLFPLSAVATQKETA